MHSLLFQALGSNDNINNYFPNSITSLINNKNKLGKTPFHYACRYGTPDTVKKLCEVFQIN